MVGGSTIYKGIEVATEEEAAGQRFVTEKNKIKVNNWLEVGSGERWLIKYS